MRRSRSTPTSRRASPPAIWSIASIRSRCRSTAAAWTSLPPSPMPAVWLWATTTCRKARTGAWRKSSPWAIGCSIRRSADRCSITPSWSVRAPSSGRTHRKRSSSSSMRMGRCSRTARSRRMATSSIPAARSSCTRRPTPTRRGWCRRRRCRTSATGWTPRASAGRGTREVTMMQSPAGPIRSFSHHQSLAYIHNLAPGTPGQRAHIKDLKDLYADIERGSLPQVSFYKPIGQLNLHPGYANITDGDAHLGELVERLQRSPLYVDTLIIVTYDENGGYWDHVPPPVRDRWGPGTRIPLIAVGPTVKRGFVDHTTYDFGSILKTIEDRFDLEPPTDADGKGASLRNMLMWEGK